MIYKVTLNGKVYEVEVEKGEAVIQAEYDAALPGNINAVNFSVGQSVKAGDVVIILEAMKMENEIVSPKAGTITKLYVQKGAVVNTGDPLFDVE